MPSFAYVAIDERGRETTGTISADSRRAATLRVREMGLFPTDVAEGAAPAKEGPERVSIFSRVTGGDLTVFTRQFANLFNAGLPVLRCIDTLIDHSENPRLRATLRDVRADVQGGGRLWETLAKHPKIFDSLYVNLVRAGEASGQLDDVMTRLADFMEYEQEQRARIKSAMAYPLVLIVAGSAAVAFLMLKIIPDFEKVFMSLGRTLPGPTMLLMSVSRFMLAYWWALLGGAVVAWLVLQGIRRTPSGGYVIDSVRLRLPVIGSLLGKIAIAQFTRTLSTLVHGGVPILEGFDVVRGTVGNRVLDRAVGEVRAAVREGESIAEPLRRTGAFPSLVSSMIAVGEETGNLDTMLAKIADAYDSEIQNRTRQLVSLVEPAIILGMGTVVGFVVIAMLLPIFEMSTAL
ncbi:MAG: type II secretion system F family protein [Armatimonadota bacterium]|jgi:type II secretion system protein F